MVIKTEQQKEAAKAFRKLVEEKQERIIRKKELLKMIGLSDATIYRMEKKLDFPRRLKLGVNSCGWLESEVNAWIKHRADVREA